MKRGYFFGIDPEGRFGLHLAVDGKWQESKSDVKLPLYKWNHIAATYDAASGIRLYWNGRRPERSRYTAHPITRPPPTSSSGAMKPPAG